MNFSRIAGSRILSTLFASTWVAVATWTLGGCGSDQSGLPNPSTTGSQDAGLNGSQGTQDAALNPHDWWSFGMADPVLDQVLLFYLGEAWQGASDIGECLDTAYRVDPSDPYGWTREWRKTADRLRISAEESELRGHPFSAAQAYLRAATYYRASLHRHPSPSDAEVQEMTDLEVAAFSKHLSLVVPNATAVQIPYESTSLPGYFFRSPLAKGDAPVIIVHEGRDAWAEDTKYVADAAMQRGYHALLIDGPGMGKVLRKQGLPFRYDWENVITPVVDFLTRQPGVDSSRLALIGMSMGGFLAPRAAAFEHRLKVVVANPGVLDWGEIVRGFLASVDPQLNALLGADADAFNRRVAELMAENSFLSWGIKDMMWHHGVQSPAALIADLDRYSLRGVLGQITSRLLVIDGEAEEFGQSSQLFDSLVGPKDYLLFTAREAAQFHVQVGASAVSSQRIFDWIDGYL